MLAITVHQILGTTRPTIEAHPYFGEGIFTWRIEASAHRGRQAVQDGSWRISAVRIGARARGCFSLSRPAF